MVVCRKGAGDVLSRNKSPKSWLSPQVHQKRSSLTTALFPSWEMTGRNTIDHFYCHILSVPLERSRFSLWLPAPLFSCSLWSRLFRLGVMSPWADTTLSSHLLQEHQQTMETPEWSSKPQTRQDTWHRIKHPEDETWTETSTGSVGC